MPLTNSQYDTLQRNYDKKQFSSFHKYLDKKQELYSKNSEFKVIDSSIASLAVRQAERLLEGDNNAVKEFKTSLIDLNKRRDSLMSSLGYSTDYLEPEYSCPDCKDTGFINGQRCHCFKQAAMDLIYNESNLNKILSNENFDNFKFDIFDKETVDSKTEMTPYGAILNAVKLGHEFIDTFDTEHRNILIMGATGVGKTFLSNCITKELIDKGHSAIYFSAFRLFDVFKENAYNKSSDVQETYQNIFNCDLLIIDDLGTEIPNSHTIAQLFMCINERILRQKSTIISTNLDLSKFADIYSERTLSRVLKKYDIINLVGRDLRFNNKSQC